MRDWRLPENRREAFQRFYTFHLRHKAHPGLVYSWLPAIAEHYRLTDFGKAWLVWLNGNTQNPVTSLLLLDVTDGDPRKWTRAVKFWDANFTKLEWDTDRRHQKSAFGKATEQWAEKFMPTCAIDWVLSPSWAETWRFALSQPYMGRLSAWSMTEYARILFGADHVPDAETLMLWDAAGSRSHRNGLAIIDGAEVPAAAYWDWNNYTQFDLVRLADLGEDLLTEAFARNPGHPDVGYLTMESALCTYKSWHKPNRRYPGVYADMAYYRLLKGEQNWGKRFGILWDARAKDLPDYLRLELNPRDPGLVPLKQNHYMEKGVPVMMWHDFPDMFNQFEAFMDGYPVRPELLRSVL